MRSLSRRDVLKLAAAGAAIAVPGALSGSQTQPQSLRPPYISNFYQFGSEALKRLSARGALPNSPRHLHIFAHSSPGIRGNPALARQVRAAGSSFKYAHPLDVHKYKGWQQADEDQLRRWATEFRQLALDRAGPADYFAFNEMPTVGAEKPPMRQQVIRWLHLLHRGGGGPRLAGVFYFTEKNLNPRHWQGESDDFWEALDQTCDLVVGEHYHNWGFVFDRTVEQYAEHLFALPRWLMDSGKAPQQRIAQQKYAVLHSSYYGPNVTGWAGIQNDRHDLVQLKDYFQRLVDATRASPFGARRIAFGPLATRELDLRLLDPLAEVLGKDARQD